MKTLILSGIRCFLMFTAAGAFSVAHPAKANPITNGGFETGDFTGWTVSDRRVFVKRTFNGIAPHSGHYQAVFTGNDIIDQLPVIIPGQSYTFDFWLAHVAGPGPGGEFAAVFGSLLLFIFDQPSFGYTHYTFDVTATAPTRILFGTVSRGGERWLLDDVSLTPTGVSVPDSGSTASLLGFALLGLAGLRRKLSKLYFVRS